MDSIHFGLSRLLSPQLSLDRSLMTDPPDASPMRTLSRMSATGDWDSKLLDLEHASGSRQLQRTSTFQKQVSGKLEKGAWLRQRPGATLFEILQVSSLGWVCK